MTTQRFIFINILTIFIIVITSQIKPQEKNYVEGNIVEYDKCGFTGEETEQLHKILGDKWGYGYDSLLIQLNNWKLSPYVKIDSIGLSVQQRPIWRLTISENPNNISNKRTIHIHARTHPQETEGFWVTREMLNILLSESELAQRIRANCVVYIIPMYNPDGVELETTRYNANGIDIESNWYTSPNQPEVAALKASFTQLMSAAKPIEVALNMHSSSLCQRYFVYHHENGTSIPYSILEQNFINGVSDYYPGGFAPWNYFVSWTSGTPLQYPESWFWQNYGENVMALTYEDIYQCSLTGNFDKTAEAILRGVMDYMGIVTDVQQIVNVRPKEFELNQNYPNPFNPNTTISWQLPISSYVTLKIFNPLGEELETLVDEYQEAGIHSKFLTINPKLTSGVYFYRFQAGNHNESKKMIYLR
jgi:hypothetical protein